MMIKFEGQRIESLMGLCGMNGNGALYSLWPFLPHAAIHCVKNSRIRKVSKSRLHVAKAMRSRPHVAKALRGKPHHLSQGRDF